MGTTIEESKRNLNHAIKWKDRPTDESMALAIETMHKYQKIEQILHNGFGKGVYAVFDEIIEVVQDGIPTGSTTKNDLGVDCISRDDVRDVMQELWGTSGELMDRLMALPSVTPQLSSELDKNSKKLEKDFGESDCISRTRAIERLKQNLPISQGADNSRDRHRYMQALADIQAIKELPSLTSQGTKA